MSKWRVWNGQIKAQILILLKCCGGILNRMWGQETPQTSNSWKYSAWRSGKNLSMNTEDGWINKVHDLYLASLFIFCYMNKNKVTFSLFLVELHHIYLYLEILFERRSNIDMSINLRKEHTGGLDTVSFWEHRGTFQDTFSMHIQDNNMHSAWKRLLVCCCIHLQSSVQHFVQMETSWELWNRLIWHIHSSLQDVFWWLWLLPGFSSSTNTRSTCPTLLPQNEPLWWRTEPCECYWGECEHCSKLLLPPLLQIIIIHEVSRFCCHTINHRLWC